MFSKLSNTVFVVTAALMGCVTTADSEECRSVESVADADVSRHAGVLSDPKICLSKAQIAEHGRTWNMTVIESAHPGPTTFLPHDNENTAFDTAVYAMMKYGGRIVAVETGETREFMGQDPNRNFGRSFNATARCRGMSSKPAEAFTAFFTSYVSPRSPFILTMHNNANGHSGNGGSGAISVLRSGSVLQGQQEPSGTADEDDAVLLAGTAEFSNADAARATTAYFHSLNMNIIYEEVSADRNDCSFSNFAVLNGLPTYYNIEAQHGHLTQQKAMLDALYGYLGVRPL